MGFKVRGIGGLKETILGGEGLVVDMTGPGKVLMQTRSVGAFLNWLLPRIPKASRASLKPKPIFSFSGLFINQGE